MCRSVNVPAHNCVDVPFGLHPAACEAGMLLEPSGQAERTLYAVYGVEGMCSVYVLAGRRHCRRLFTENVECMTAMRRAMISYECL